MTQQRIKKAYLFTMFILIIVSLVVNVINMPYKEMINMIILAIFALDSFYSLWKTENRKNYLRHHFLDFIAIIPFHHGFRLVKFFPIIMQSIQITSLGQRYFLPVFFKLRETGTGKLFNIFLIIFIFLRLPLLQTVTTVGYGDIVIQTGLGRLIGGILMVLGVGIISAFTSSLTRAISHSKKSPYQKTDDIIEELLQEKSFSQEDLEVIEAWLELEKKKQQKLNNTTK